MMKHRDDEFKHRHILSHLSWWCDHVTAWSNLEPPALALFYGLPEVFECKVNEPASSWLNSNEMVGRTQLRSLDVVRLASIETDFIYTAVSNSYDEAKIVLNNADNVSRFIAFQHITPFWRRGSDRKPGLSNAFYEFQETHPEWRPIYRGSENWGVVIFSKVERFFVDGIKWNPKLYHQEDLDREDRELKAKAIERTKRATLNYARSHWLRLHKYAIECGLWDERAARAFYAEWLEGIPTTSCNCRSHWMELTTDNPPDFSSREAFFEWTWARHNDVNRRLKKPEITLAEAYEATMKAINDLL